MTYSELSYRRKISALHESLGIDPDYEKKRGFPLQLEAVELAPIGLDQRGLERELAPAAAKAWLSLTKTAAADGVSILLRSAFRSAENQAGEIRRRLDRGEPIDQILSLLAAPGFSEHHTGRAVDLGCAEARPLHEEFETTEAFRWLTRRAGEFGFRMSYPRENPFKIRYEPWHWCFWE